MYVLRSDLGEDRDAWDLGVLGGVGERFARCPDNRAGGVVEAACSDGRYLDGHVELVLHLLGHSLGRGGEVVAIVRLPAVEPCAQLPVGAAGERAYGPRVVGSLVDKRERLEHRIMQVGGDLGPLLGARPGSSL